MIVTSEPCSLYCDVFVCLISDLSHDNVCMDGREEQISLPEPQAAHKPAHSFAEPAGRRAVAGTGELVDDDARGGWVATACASDGDGGVGNGTFSSGESSAAAQVREGGVRVATCMTVITMEHTSSH